MANINTTTRAKFGYLTYEDMLQKINDNIIDAYDICFTKDTKECFVITEELEPSPIHSRVYVFNDIDEAVIKLNNNSDTYNGQIVAILNNDVYVGYIVNTVDNKFIVTPLYEFPEAIDYNTLGNRPIINLIGTLDSPIMISNLDNGIYRVKGQYKISDLEETIYLSMSDIIFIISKGTDGTTIKKITSEDIVNYFINDSDIYKNTYVTDEYLKNNNYITSDYVDSKIEALELSLKKDMESYVKDIVDEVLGDTLDEKISKQIDDSFQTITESQITDLF